MLIILFGLTGSGKNFVAEIFQHLFYFDWLDGDNFLTIEMKQAIQQKKIFTQSMRNVFTQKLIQVIEEKKDATKNLVVTQALYKEKNRQQILAAFPEVKFIQIKADFEKIQKRIQQRNDEVSFAYAEEMSHQFEKPNHVFSEIINNSGKDEVIRQINRLLFN